VCKIGGENRAGFGETIWLGFLYGVAKGLKSLNFPSISRKDLEIKAKMQRNQLVVMKKAAPPPCKAVSTHPPSCQQLVNKPQQGHLIQSETDLFARYDL